jgi:hypothetical protein
VEKVLKVEPRLHEIGESAFSQHKSFFNDNWLALHDPNALVYPMKAGSVVCLEDGCVCVGADPVVARGTSSRA